MAATTMRTRLPARDESLVQLGVRSDKWDFLVALAGNPNTGKSTVFNALTGLRQHTGNWPGKTVTRAEGYFTVGGDRFKMVDLPGTYSLQAASTDEEVARDALLFGAPDVTVIVLDATRLERNLNLALQVLEITPRVVVCLNLMDEAKRLGIGIDPAALSRELGVPVVPAAMRQGEGIDALRTAIQQVARGEIAPAPTRARDFAPEVEALIHEVEAMVHEAEPERANTRWVALRLLNADERVAAMMPAEVVARANAVRWRLSPDFHDRIAEGLYASAERIAARAALAGLPRAKFDLDRTLDRWLTSPLTGFPLMVLMLGVVFWLTIAGANVPSGLLADLLVDRGHPFVRGLMNSIGSPWWLTGVLVDGVYLATAWVIAVMLPPMAIFFPLFTLLEDFGYLPRVAFNLDALFRRVGAHGKQALTMCMGFGCNAAGVVATRVIDSPRERLVAIITNNFSLCNGRWPTQILMASLFIGALVPAALGGLVSAAAVVGVTLIGVLAMFASSWLLTRTALRGEATSFSLELPPYRPPRLWQTLYTSIIDRTLIVLWRAIVFAAPAGAVIWLVGNVGWGGESVAQHLVRGLDPVGILLGMNGVILLAYVVAIPANEIVIPTVLMLTVLVGGTPEAGAGAGVMFELDQAQIGALLRANGWTTLTAVNLMLFSLLHNPCSTTIYTIWRETRSAKWTTVATLLPLGMGFVLTFLVAQVWRIIAGG
ncbi:MAG: ferrous iron transport protein B [Gemmatimonadaceae bacterium]|jgi:ferrous iron transport protein B|nr:ferrous iron transport protein B [Gemmatimonadaceae bacterium]